MTQTYFQTALRYIQNLQEHNQITFEEKQILKIMLIGQDVCDQYTNSRDAVTRVSQKLKTIRRIKRQYVDVSNDLLQITEKSFEIDS